MICLENAAFQGITYVNIVDILFEIRDVLV